MCEGASAVIGIVGAVVSAVGSYVSYQQQADAQEKAATYNAQMAENQAAIEEENARNEIAKGIADRERQQRQAARAMGEMRAGMGASGFEMDSGSNLSLLAESAAEHQYDSAVITSNAEQAAWQHQVSALTATNQKDMYEWQAANANSGQTASLLSATGTLLGGIGNSIGKYNQWQQGQKSGGI